MKIKDFLNFIRWKNLLMLALVQILIKYVFFLKFDLETNLNAFYFLALLFSTILIAAGGYIINDIYDVQTDLINKPSKVFVGKKISEKTSFQWYAALTLIGVLLGISVSIQVGNLLLISYFFITAILLYAYAIKLKKKFITGNIIISILVLLSILILPVFDLIPVQNNYDEKVVSYLFNILLKVSIFAFLLTLIREIVKDIEDIRGDYQIRSNSLPISFGISRTKHIILFISIFPILFILYFGIQYLVSNPFVLYYLLIFIILPLLYFDKKLLSAKSKADYKKLSNLLKYIMLFGIFTIIIL